MPKVTQGSQAQQDAMSRACSTCQSPAGVYCTDMNANSMPEWVHSARTRAELDPPATMHEETRARQTGATVEQLRKETREARIAELRERINQLGEELYQLVAPSKGELLALEADVQVNPHIYVSYLIGDGDGDHTWIAFNVLEEREAQAAMQDDIDPERDGPGGVYGRGE